MNPEALREIYQIKVSLVGLKPPVWRRILVPSTITLEKMHDVLQISLGWTDSHLHQFVVGRRCYGVPDPDFRDSMVDEQGVRLSQLLKKEKDSLRYDYDFGDGWEHKVQLEKVLPFDPDITLPRCIKGRRACPPEDVGGTWGYEEFLKGLADPSHPEHAMYVEWIGGTFDSEDFSADEVNELLSECFK